MFIGNTEKENIVEQLRFATQVVWKQGGTWGIPARNVVWSQSQVLPSERRHNRCILVDDVKDNGWFMVSFHKIEKGPLTGVSNNKANL